MCVSWPTGVQLVVFFCSSIPVVLFTPQISLGISTRCVSSLFHYRLYMWFCGCLIIFVCLSLWCLGLNGDLIVDVPKFTYLLWVSIETGVSIVPFRCFYSWPFQCISVTVQSRLSALVMFHYENTPVQIYWKFHHQKIWKFSNKNSDIFHISAQNIDCRYSLEPPRRGGSNEYPQSMFWAEIWKIMYTPVNSSFTV